MNKYQKNKQYESYYEPYISIPIDSRIYNSLEDHGIPVNPIPGRLYNSLEEHGIPANPIPGRLYFPFPIFPF